MRVYRQIREYEYIRKSSILQINMCNKNTRVFVHLPFNSVSLSLYHHYVPKFDTIIILLLSPFKRIPYTFNGLLCYPFLFIQCKYNIQTFIKDAVNVYKHAQIEKRIIFFKDDFYVIQMLPFTILLLSYMYLYIYHVWGVLSTV